MSERRQSSPHRNLIFNFLLELPQDLAEVLLALYAPDRQGRGGTHAVWDPGDLEASLGTTRLVPGEKDLSTRNNMTLPDISIIHLNQTLQFLEENQNLIKIASLELWERLELGERESQEAEEETRLPGCHYFTCRERTEERLYKGG